MRIACPCGERFRADDAPPVGPVRCPRCGRWVGPDDAEGVTTATGANPSRRSLPDEDFDSGDSRRDAVRKKSAEPAPSHALLWVVFGVSVAGVLGLLVALLVLMVVLPFGPPSGPAVPAVAVAVAEEELAPDQIPPVVKEAKPVPAVVAGELKDLAHVSHLAFSPDGKSLATVQSFSPPMAGVVNVLQVWDVASGKQLLELHHGNDDVETPTFSRDGRLLACHYFHRSKVKVWELREGNEVRLFSAPKEIPFHGDLLAFSPDGAAISAASEKYLFRLEMAGGTVQRLGQVEITQHHRLAAMPTRPVIAVSGKRLALIDATDGTGRIACPLSGTISEMAFSDDGKTLAVAYGQGHIDAIDTARWEVQATLEREPTESFNYYCHLHVSRDGRSVLGMPSFGRGAGSFGRAEIWDVAAGRMRKYDFAAFSRLAFSPDGGTVAVAPSRARLLLIDARTGEEKVAGNPVPRGGR